MPFSLEFCIYTGASGLLYTYESKPLSRISKSVFCNEKGVTSHHSGLKKAGVFKGKGFPD